MPSYIVTILVLAEITGDLKLMVLKLTIHLFIAGLLCFILYIVWLQACDLEKE